jgi:5-methyltetrahydropteroyltriglutamate--homocysteine methyltransferase
MLDRRSGGFGRPLTASNTSARAKRSQRLPIAPEAGAAPEVADRRRLRLSSLEPGDLPMLASTDRILVTHVGSLPRNETLSDLLIRQEAGETIDRTALAGEVEAATRHVIQSQLSAGVDVGNDGEQSRVGFQTYVPRCLCGFGGESKRPPARDQIEFPSYARQMAARFPHSARVTNAPAALAEVRYVDGKPIRDDAQRLKELGGAFRETFMTAPSPGIVATTMLDQHYGSHEKYLMALANALSNEYRAIHDAGHVLQIDSPDLAMERHRFFGHLDERAFLEQLALHVAAINKGIEGIPRDRVRLHVCWGNNDGPHIYDIAMATILPELYRANVGALSIEFANPRHQHEYDALKANPLPAHMLLIPGVLDTTTNFVEHPQVVARRLIEAVAAVGDKERVIAGTDCGFGTFAGREYVAEEVVWLKLGAAAEGARIASKALWGR